MHFQFHLPCKLLMSLNKKPRLKALVLLKSGNHAVFVDSTQSTRRHFQDPNERQGQRMPGEFRVHGPEQMPGRSRGAWTFSVTPGKDAVSTKQPKTPRQTTVGGYQRVRGEGLVEEGKGGQIYGDGVTDSGL